MVFKNLEDLCNLELRDESVVIKSILPQLKFSSAEKKLIEKTAEDYINTIRSTRRFTVEEFINRFSLSTSEGVAIMCLAEGLLRIPDHYISKKIILDKFTNKTWGSYVFKSSSSLKTFLASVGLLLSGTYAEIITKQNFISDLIDRVGTIVFIKILKSALLYLSNEFIFSPDIYRGVEKAVDMDKYNFAFDLLGESSRTMQQADEYFQQYLEAIYVLSSEFPENNNLWERPNISVKLSALHPRFELNNFDNLESELMPKIIKLVEKVQDNNLTITFDAEESFRLDCYLLFLGKLLLNKKFAKFEGIGIVIQAYHVRSYEILQRIIEFAKKHKKIIPIRLVKGAYWDTEIKNAQIIGMKHYPVFTKKDFTDASYIACCKLIMDNTEYIYPQFATHNALTAAYVKLIAGDKDFEFQKLFGMGDILHEQLADVKKVRIYSPVGKNKDLLAYLMRRLLENGANSSFVNKVVNQAIPSEDLIYDVYDKVINLIDSGQNLVLPENIYPNRKNAMGYDLGYKTNYDYLEEKVTSMFSNTYLAGSIINGKEEFNKKHAQEHFCPAKNAEKVSSISYAYKSEIEKAIDFAVIEFEKWSNHNVQERAAIINEIANLYEQNKLQLYAILIQEAGKSIQDAVNEVIEAIDFCRYYANEATKIMHEQLLPGPTGERNTLSLHGRGVFLCISPWNFPLAIFTGQIVAALVCGNTVIAKPSDQTSVIANFAVKLMHKAGVPKGALHLILSSGSNISKYAVSDRRIDGVAFTGSTKTAQIINQTLAARNAQISPLIAETGGQNAMIVDSSALLEQVTDSVIQSAFLSAGQRCSALRMLYVQEEIYDELLIMIKGAMEILKIGDTANFSMDIGPVIDKASYDILDAHIDDMKKKGFKVTEHPRKGNLLSGYFFYPHIIEVNSINDLEEEKFGPILHVAKYKAKQLDKVIDEINNYGFGLTFGVHSRIEEQISHISSRIKVGNIYANRSIIGAKVESQPFGGEGLSGTGFKAGGPYYLLRFCLERTSSINLTAIGGNIELFRSQKL